MLTKRLEKNLTEIVQECWELYWTNPGSNISQNSSCTTTYHSSLKQFQSDKQDMQDTAGRVRANSYMVFSSGPHHTEEQVLNDRLCMEKGCSPEDLPNTMDDRDYWQERERERERVMMMLRNHKEQDDRLKIKDTYVNNCGTPYIMDSPSSINISQRERQGVHRSAWHNHVWYHLPSGRIVTTPLDSQLSTN